MTTIWTIWFGPAFPEMVGKPVWNVWPSSKLILTASAVGALNPVLGFGELVLFVQSIVSPSLIVGKGRSWPVLQMIVVVELSNPNWKVIVSESPSVIGKKLAKPDALAFPMGRT